MQVLLQIIISSDFSDFASKVKERFGEQDKFFIALRTTTALPAHTAIPYGSLFKRNEDEDEVNATLVINPDSYYPDYEPLDDQLIYTVVPYDDFNLTETEFVAWLAEEWVTDRLKVKAA